MNKKLWLLYLILSILTLGIFDLYLAFKLDIYDKDAWYSKWQYWFFGTVCLIFPVFIMFIVFLIQMMCKTAMTLKVSGSNIYYSPYTWILCIIIPVVGWCLLIVMYLYILLMPSIELKIK